MEKEYDGCSKKIMKATYNLLQKETSENISIDNIASEANTNSRTIYRKFENKKDLIESTKEYYLKIFLVKLNNIFSFDADDEIKEYLSNVFLKLFNLQDDELNIIKIAIGEVYNVSEKNKLITEISEVIISNLKEYFKVQRENGKIKDVDINVLSILCFEIIFQSLSLMRLSDILNIGIESYSEEILNILNNGIKSK